MRLERRMQWVSVTIAGLPVVLNGGLDKLLGGYVGSEVIDLNTAALHHDLDKVFADIVHISAHGSDNGASDCRALAAFTDHVRL